MRKEARSKARSDRQDTIPLKQSTDCLTHGELDWATPQLQNSSTVLMVSTTLKHPHRSPRSTCSVLDGRRQTCEMLCLVAVEDESCWLSGPDGASPACGKSPEARVHQERPCRRLRGVCLAPTRNNAGASAPAADPVWRIPTAARDTKTNDGP